MPTPQLLRYALQLLKLTLIYTLAFNHCFSFSFFSSFFFPLTLSFDASFKKSNFYAYGDNINHNPPLKADGSTNTVIDKAANGLPIVNIAAPNSGGLSHNKFIDYNVGQSGLIINNATGNNNGVIHSKLGGLIVDNPHLKNSGSAFVILNEVSSTNKSLINGYTEIAGKNAELIIANPNGVKFAGAGFINIDRLTTVIGSSEQFNPHPHDLTFDLAGNDRNNSDIGNNNFLPKLVISNLGLDISEINNIDLIAQTMDIVSPIYGSDNSNLNLKLGDKTFNYHNKEVSAHNNGDNPPEITEIALDVSNLANIKAGQIYIITTKNGAGVTYSANMLASRNGIIIDANGNVTYKGTMASDGGDININAQNKADITITDEANIITKNGGNVTLTSNQGDINNKGNIINLDHGDINLISINGNIINDANGELITNGNLNMAATNGIIEQSSPNSVVVDGNYTINTHDYINTGRIDISGDLTMNITNDLINDIGALIYAGGNMALNIINKLINNEDGVIYADHNITINAGEIDNISAHIQSYAGDITIEAAKLNNLGINYDNYDNIDHISTDPDEFFGYDRSNMVSKDSYGENYYRLMNQDEITSTLRTKQANITAVNGDININNTLIHNYSSSISAADDITIHNASLHNETATILVTDLRQQYGKHWTIKKRPKPWKSHKIYHHYHSYIANYNSQATSADVANIKAGSNFTINAITQVNNGYQNTALNIAINEKLRNDITNIGKIDSDNSYLHSYINGHDYQGIFQKSTNPNAPLFETRSQFINQSIFFGSDYFYDKIGVNLVELHERIIGDQLFQTQLLQKQLKSIRKDAMFLSDNEVNVNNEMQSLIDNATTEYERLNLPVNQALTPAQIANLQKDIIWYELEIINGDPYIIPKIYLCQETRNKLNDNDEDALTLKSTLMALGEIHINTVEDDVNNSGDIISANNITIIAQNNLNNNNFSNINAGNNLTLITNNGTISNRSTLKAGNNIALIANNDIINTATVITNDSNLLNNNNSQQSYIPNNHNAPNNGHIFSNLLEIAMIEAGNNFNAIASNDFNNIGANITTVNNTSEAGGEAIETEGEETAGNINITSYGGDVNIKTIQIRNRREHHDRECSEINYQTHNFAANINSTGNLTINADNNIAIAGSNINSSDHGNITAGNQLEITSVEDKSYNFTQTNTENELGSSRNSSSSTNSITQLGSSINITGNLILQAVNDLNITASNINSNETLDLISNLGDVNIKNALNYLTTAYSNSDSNIYEQTSQQQENYQETAIISNISAHNINITSHDIGNVNIIGSNINSANNLNITTNDGQINLAAAQQKSASFIKSQETRITSIDREFKDGALSISTTVEGTRHQSSTQTTTNIASNLTAGNNINLNSQEDTNITATNIIAGHNIDINATTGNVNITDATDSTSINEENSEITIESGIKIGNAYVDVGYAAKAVNAAKKNLKKAHKKLKKIKKLKKEGKASQKAVDLAITQLTLATAGLVSATTSFTLSLAGAATASSSSLGTGMYGAGYVRTTAHTDFNTTSSKQSKSANIIANNNINISTLNKDLNITGSNIQSAQGDISLQAHQGNINLKAGQSSHLTQTGSKTVTTNVSVGSNGMGLAAGYNQSDNYALQVNYHNSQILANNGQFSLMSNQDTNIIGANIIANTIDNITIGGDLHIESLQDSYEAQGMTIGINFSEGQGNNEGTHKSPEEQQAQDNDPKNNTNIGISLGLNDSFGKFTKQQAGIIELANNNPNLTPNQHFNNIINDSQKTQISGNITNNIVKQDSNVINADFNGYIDSQTIANIANAGKWLGQLASNGGRKEIMADLGELGNDVKETFIGTGQDLETIRTAIIKELQELTPENNPVESAIIETITSPISAIEGTINSFVEPNDSRGSQNYRVNNQGEIIATTSPSQTKFYNVNGVMTPEEVAKMNYLNKSENTDLTIRHNPSHGIVGDLIESGIGKIANAVGVPEAVSMNRIVAEDLHQRKDIHEGINNFHSQGTIIATGAIEIYGTKYQDNNPINITQKFNALGPAVLEEDWKLVVKDNRDEIDRLH